MEQRIGAFDWASTPLGPRASWPSSLETSLTIMLASPYPMYIAWGPSFVQLYNDAYKVILGPTKHPDALGRTALDTFPEAWPIIEPLFRQVTLAGEPVWREDEFCPLQRAGFLEECYFTFGYSAVRDEHGAVSGLLAILNETTNKVLSERRLATLRNLGAQMTGASSTRDAVRRACEALAANRHDLPFVQVYTFDNGTMEFRGAVGYGGCLVPATGAEATAAMRALLESDHDAVVRQACAIDASSLEAPAWPEPVRELAYVPIVQSGTTGPIGVLVAGLSPRLAYDTAYGNFLGLIASQLGDALAAARASQLARERAEQLAEFDRIKTAFIGQISHEFRTPLTLMLGSLQELHEDAALNPRSCEHVAVAARSAQRLLKLVDALLDYSQIQAARSTVRYEATDLPAFTAELVGLFRSAVERAGLRLTTDCPPIDRPVFVDRTMWECIVLNLLSNALKYTLRGEIRVRLSAGADEVRFAVQDTGIGIPEEDVERVFERFHRVPCPEARSCDGSGIGLALVKEMVELHGGSISVDSRVGVGSTFTLHIPYGTPALTSACGAVMESASTRARGFVAEAEQWIRSAEAVGSVEPAADAGVTAAPDTPYVLVVEDDPDMRAYLLRVLNGVARIVSVADGVAALEAIDRAVPDLVLTDVMLPRLDGLQLLAAMRDRHDARTVPVLLVSARGDETSRLAGLSLGADDYIVKPFIGRELRARVESHLTLTRLRREAEQEQWMRRCEAEQWRDRLRFLADASVALSQSLDVRATLKNVAALAVPRMADLCAIDLIDGAGKVERVVVRHEDPGALQIVRDVSERYPPQAGAPWGIMHVIQTGRSELHSDISDDLLGALAQSPEHLTLLRRLDCRSVMIVPLIARDRTLGALTLLSSPSGRRFAREDLDLAEALATRAALAIENAQLLEEARHASEKLEQRVNERTETLAAINAQLSLEMQERQKTAMALRESEAQLLRFANATTDALWTRDLPQGPITRNSGVARILGYGESDLPSTLEWWVEHIHPADRTRVLRTFEQVLAAPTTAFSCQYRLRRQDGSYATVMDRVFVVRDERGAARRMLGAMTDLTDRVQQEWALLHVQEAERHRIARDLHDQLGQMLTLIQVRLMAERDAVGHPTAADSLDKSALMVAQAIDQVRDLCFDLRPSVLDDLGLVPALREHVSRLSRSSGVHITLHAAPDLGERRWSSDIETACFRVAQEALSNVLRHARATTARVHLSARASSVALRVSDDGIGFDLATVRRDARHGRTMGLSSMQERTTLAGGTLEIRSAAGRGTTIDASFPVD